MIARRSLFLLAATGWALPRLSLGQQPPAEAPLRLEGRALARRITLSGAELRLNGAGVRAVAWFKAFVAALYLGTPARSAAEAIAATGPKRLQMHLLTDVPAAELSKALRRGVQRNLPVAEQNLLAAPLQALSDRIDAMNTLRKGDVLDLDWDPPRGMRLSLNGKLQSEPRDPAWFSQPALYAAVLRAFLGEKPYDERLKTGLLTAPARPPSPPPGD